MEKCKWLGLVADANKRIEMTFIMTAIEWYRIKENRTSEKLKSWKDKWTFVNHRHQRKKNLIWTISFRHFVCVLVCSWTASVDHLFTYLLSFVWSCSALLVRAAITTCDSITVIIYWIFVACVWIAMIVENFPIDLNVVHVFSLKLSSKVHFHFRQSFSIKLMLF